MTFEAVGNKLMHRMLKCKELPLRQRLFHCQLPVMYGRQMKFQSPRCRRETTPYGLIDKPSQIISLT